MPHIQGFEAPDSLAIHPSEAGSAAMREAGGVARQFANQSGAQANQGAAAMAAGIKAVGTGIGNLYDDYKDHEDTVAATDASKKSADFDMDQHDKLNHIMDPEPDPNDPSGKTMTQKDPNNAKQYIGSFLNNWWTARQEVRGTITNDKALKKFDSETESGYRGISAKAYSIYGEVNFNAVRDNIIKSTNSRAGVAFADPNQMDAMLAQTKTDLADMSSKVPGISADQRSKMQTEIETNASRLIIERGIDGMSRTPGGRQQATELINSGKYDQYIGEDKGKLLDHVRTMDRAQTADLATQHAQAQREAKDKALARTDQYIQDAQSDKPQAKLTDIWTDPAYNNHPELRKEAAGVFETMQKMQKGDLNVSPALSHKTTLDLMSRMSLPDGDPNKLTSRSDIDKAMIGETLTKQDHNFLTAQFKQLNSEPAKELAKSRTDFFKDYQRTIDPYSLAQSGPSALGNENMYRAKQDAIKAEAAATAAGEDPRTVYDPNSKNFFGRPENLAKYHTPLADAQKYNDQIAKSLNATISKYAPQRVTLADPAKAQGGAPMEIAQRYLGMDAKHNHEALTAFLNKTGGEFLDPAKTAWCARYVNSVLASSGQEGSGSDAAKSFLKVGQAVDPFSAQPGDVIVFDRGNNPAQGHVGFVQEVNGDKVKVLAGNQGGAVSVKEYSLGQAVGVRRLGKFEMGGAIPGPLGTAGADYAVAKIPAAPPRSVTSAEEAYKLPPGTRIKLPDGRFGTVPYPQVPQSR